VGRRCNAPCAIGKKHSSAEPPLRPTQHTYSVPASERPPLSLSCGAREVGPSTACTELMLARLLIALLCHTTLTFYVHKHAASFVRSFVCFSALKCPFRWNFGTSFGAEHFSGRGSTPPVGAAANFWSGIHTFVARVILTITT